LTIYKLVFKEEAKKEWDRLDKTIRTFFVKKLKERLTNPHVAGDRLRGMPECYKIKLRNAGYRLVYQVRDHELIVSVIAVGIRERNKAYKAASKRI